MCLGCAGPCVARLLLAARWSEWGWGRACALKLLVSMCEESDSFISVCSDVSCMCTHADLPDPSFFRHLSPCSLTFSVLPGPFPGVCFLRFPSSGFPLVTAVSLTHQQNLCLLSCSTSDRVGGSPGPCRPLPDSPLGSLFQSSPSFLCLWGAGAWPCPQARRRLALAVSPSVSDSALQMSHPLWSGKPEEAQLVLHWLW